MKVLINNVVLKKDARVIVAFEFWRHNRFFFLFTLTPVIRNSVCLR